MHLSVSKIIYPPCSPKTMYFYQMHSVIKIGNYGVFGPLEMNVMLFSVTYLTCLFKKKEILSHSVTVFSTILMQK
jgi:hypothetical protein